MLTRMSPPAAGDLAFGLLVFLGFADDPWAALPAFALTGLLSAVIFVAFGVVTGSLAFWSGSSEGLARLMNDAVLVFSSYPDSVFGGWTRLLLYTALPAAFVTHVPVHVVRTGSPLWLLALAAAALAWAAGAVGLFRAGLRRYESGNLIVGLNEG
jgi:ABC-2 type transport system permease protein